MISYNSAGAIGGTGCPTITTFTITNYDRDQFNYGYDAGGSPGHTVDWCQNANPTLTPWTTGGTACGTCFSIAPTAGVDPTDFDEGTGVLEADLVPATTYTVTYTSDWTCPTSPAAIDRTLNIQAPDNPLLGYPASPEPSIAADTYCDDEGIENFHETFLRLFSGEKLRKLVLKVM